MNSLWKSYQISLLALAMWREARGEGSEAMIAIGCALRNRAQKPCWWGKNLIAVITKKWQVSSMAAPGDRQLILYPQEGDKAFDQALSLAGQVINGLVENLFPGADSWYDDSIPAPKWATKDNFCGKIGRLSFHNVDMDTEDIKTEVSG